MSNWIFRSILALLLLAYVGSAQAQEESELPLIGPINSDPLTIRGISPRVLDITLFPMSQGLYWEMLLNYQSVGKAGEARSERFRMIFDPYTDYGRDLYFEFETEPLESLKRYKRKWVPLHTWGRMLKYRHSDFGEIAWQHAPDELFVNKPTAKQPAIAQAEAPVKTTDSSPLVAVAPVEDGVLDNVVVTSKTRQEITDEFAIGIDIEETLFLLGINKDIGRNWNFNAFGGLNGTRSSLMASFGYRW